MRATLIAANLFFVLLSITILHLELRDSQHVLAKLFSSIAQGGTQSFLDYRVIEGHFEHLLDDHV